MLALSGRLPLRFRSGLAVVISILLFAGLSLFSAQARAQTFPELTGRVVDGANIIPADEKVRLEQKLEALEKQSQRQLVVVTLPDLQGYEISDFGYQLGRKWGLGDKDRNDGALLIIAPKERKVRIEVGYGLEPVLTDGFSTLIIQNEILPRFKAGDMPGGIEAGVDAISKQLTLPADQAQLIAAQAKPKAAPKADSIVPALFWLGLFFFFFVPLAIARSRKGRRYSAGSGLGPLIVWDALSHMSSGGGGGGGSSWGGGGGFSGGGGSFGGGGASGSW